MPQQKLTPKLIRQLLPEANSQTVEKLDLSGKDIAQVRRSLVSSGPSRDTLTL